jgi:hypothetical protein
LCPHALVSKQGAAFNRVAGCSRIGRVGVPTIYPPVAEGYFLAVQTAAPADDSSLPIQAAGAACATLTTLVLLFGLRRLGRNVRLAALWAWCPTVLLEAGNNAHVDSLAVLLTAVSLLVLARARTEGKAMLGGALLGLAIATKMTPVLVVPGVVRRAWQHIAVAAGAAIVVVYMPHLMTVGSRVIGFFPGYLNEQGYSSGTGFAIISVVAPGKLAIVVAGALLAAIALAILKFGDPDQPWRAGVPVVRLAPGDAGRAGRPAGVAGARGRRVPGRQPAPDRDPAPPARAVRGLRRRRRRRRRLRAGAAFLLGDTRQFPRPPALTGAARRFRLAGRASGNRWGSPRLLFGAPASHHHDRDGRGAGVRVLI